MGNDTAQSRPTRLQTTLAASTIEDLIEIVLDLTRRGAACEIELAGSRIYQAADLDADDY